MKSITFNELELLRVIFFETLTDEEVFGSNLAKALDMTYYWTYVLLERMVKKGFLQKEPQNGSRKVIYELTDFGETVAKRWIDLVEVLAEKQEPQPQEWVEKWKVI